MITGMRHRHVWPSPWRSIWSRHTKQAIKNVLTLSPGVQMKMMTVIIFSSLRLQFSQERIEALLSCICGSSLQTLSGSVLPQMNQRWFRAQPGPCGPLGTFRASICLVSGPVLQTSRFGFYSVARRASIDLHSTELTTYGLKLGVERSQRSQTKTILNSGFT